MTRGRGGARIQTRPLALVRVNSRLNGMHHPREGAPVVDVDSRGDRFLDAVSGKGLYVLGGVVVLLVVGILIAGLIR